MRDAIVTLIVFGSVPVILFRPWVGVLVFSWLSYMNPHRLAWGFAHDLPFAQVVALTTVCGMVFSREKKSLPNHWLTWVWILFLVWMCITTILALDTKAAEPQWEKVMKIQVFALITIALIRDQKQLHLFLWVIVVSLGFFGF